MEATDIRLIDVEQVVDPRFSAWKVTLGYFPSHTGDPDLKASWTFPQHQYADADILPIARSYFHAVCLALAEKTADWRMSTEDIASRRLDTKVRE